MPPTEASPKEGGDSDQEEDADDDDDDARGDGQMLEDASVPIQKPPDGDPDVQESIVSAINYEIGKKKVGDVSCSELRD